MKFVATRCVELGMNRPCQRCGRDNTEEAKFCFHCGAMLEVDSAEASDPLVGKILLNRYRIVRILGEGGMGRVYLAEQKMGAATRNVAIKTLHRELSNDRQLVARFHRESETVIGLTHPNTIQFYDFGELEDSTLFIVMEYIEGESLAHVLERGPIELSRVDRLLIQICGSLNEAHQLGVVHRDLKPENILLTDRGGQKDFVKVLDFGIAKQSEAEDANRTKLTMQGMVLGTPPYMSPEQFGGQSLDARSDVYSLGIVTYEMLTGRLPFEANTPWEWASQHLTTPPMPLDEHPGAAHVPANKKAAVMRALSKNRDDRQASVTVFLREFTGFQDTQQAWALATSPAAFAATMVPSTTAAGAVARGPVGTPGPLPESRSMPAANVSESEVASPAFQGPPRPHYESEPIDLPKNGGLGKVAAVLGVLGILAGLAVAGLFAYASRDETATAQKKPAQNEESAEKNEQPSQKLAGEGSSEGPSKAANVVQSTPSTKEDPGTQDDRGAQDDAVLAVVGEETASADAEEAQADETLVPEASGEPRPPREPDATRPRRPTERRQGSPRRDVRPAADASEEIDQAKAAISRGDLASAVQALRAAQGKVGARHPSVRAVRSQLASGAANKVGILLLQGQCDAAQALYRQVRSVGAEAPSRQHFTGDWCPRP